METIKAYHRQIESAPANWSSIAKGRNSRVGALLVAIRYNPAIRACYQRMLDRGKVRMTAIIAYVRKLLVLMNAMLAKNTPRNPDFA